MKIRVKPYCPLKEVSDLFQIPLPLIQDSQRGGGELECVDIPGFAAIPYIPEKDDTAERLACKWNIDPAALMFLNGSRSFIETLPGRPILIPSRIISPIAMGKTNYHSRLLDRDIAILKEAYPFLSIENIGKSVSGKVLKEIRVGRGKRKIHFNASFHANEWITSGILMDLVNSYLLALTNSFPFYGHDALKIYDDIELSIVPMVNPDGVDLVLNGPPIGREQRLLEVNSGSRDFSGWKANLNGVDLNNQFPANWEIEKERKEPKSPAPRDYPGNAPLTEPEARAMSGLAIKRNFDMVIAFHTQGEEFYWGYGGKEPEVSRAIAKEFERKSGYRAVHTIDSHAGFKDWFIQDFGQPGFTIELGRGINPLPLSKYDGILSEISGIFIAALTAFHTV